MKITKSWLRKNNACLSGYDWFVHQDENDYEAVVAALMKANRFDWANWVIVRLMNRKQKVKYACYVARLALPIYERYHPRCNRLRQELEAAEIIAAKNSAAVYTTAVGITAAAYVAAITRADVIVANATYLVATTVTAAGYFVADDDDDKNVPINNKPANVKTKIINYGLSLIK